MCLVALGWKAHPRWRLLLAGNRDEFHERSSAALSAWAAPFAGIVAGRDLRSGGTWAGVDRNGRVAVVTNVRDPAATQAGPSRGQLTTDFLQGQASASEAIAALAARSAEFAPFNLVLADAQQCHYLGNHPPAQRMLPPGFHGISNGPLDPPWPKTVKLTQALAAWAATDHSDLSALWQALRDEQPAQDEDLPDTGIGQERERWLSSAFIRSPRYGTRASTLIAIDHDGHGWIQERRYAADGSVAGHTRIEISDASARLS